MKSYPATRRKNTWITIPPNYHKVSGLSRSKIISWVIFTKKCYSHTTPYMFIDVHIYICSYSYSYFQEHLLYRRPLIDYVFREQELFSAEIIQFNNILIVSVPGVHQTLHIFKQTHVWAFNGHQTLKGYKTRWINHHF